MEAITRFPAINDFQRFFIHRQQEEQQPTGTIDKQPQTRQQTDTKQGNPGELTPEEKQQVEELKKRDREVRQHEQAHKTAAGGFVTSGPHFDFQRGPDGRQYAVGGEVKLDTTPIADDPEATIRKAQVIRRAALAPGEPSPQDRRVAADASAMERDARIESREKQREEAEEELQAGETSQTTKAQSSNTRGSLFPSFFTGSVFPGAFIDLLA